MMKGSNKKQETIVDVVKKVLKDFDRNKLRAIKHLGDSSWVAKMMGCDENIVITSFNDASHEFNELDSDTREVLIACYATGMESCKGRLEKGTNAFDRMRKFINGVTNCYATAAQQSKDDITDTDKLFSAWVIQYIYCMLTDSKKADTFTASHSQPKQPKSKDEPKPDDETDVSEPSEVKPTLFTRWLDTFKMDGVTASGIETCTTDISTYIYKNMSSGNMLGEICAFAVSRDIRNIANKIAILLTSSSEPVNNVLSTIEGFASQFCGLVKIIGCPDWMKVDGLTMPDTTCDSDKYAYGTEDVVKTYLDNLFGGDVIKYIAS